MRYQAPYGNPGGPNDESAAFVNGNPAAGVKGSIAPAQVWEYPERELLAIIKAGGLTPLDTDLQQVLRVSRGQVPTYLQDTGTANHIIGSYLNVSTGSPALNAYRPGSIYRVKVAVTNTGPMDINIDAQGVVNIVRGDGGSITGSEVPAGAIIDLVYDGVNMQLISQTQRSGFLGIIDTNIVKTVYGGGADFATLEAALYWLSRYIISQTGFVTFSIATGLHIISTGSQFVDHPNATRIAFVSQGTYTPPSLADFQFTGNSGAALSNDQAAQLTMLRTKYPCELRFTLGSSIACIGGSSWTGMLVTGDGSQTGTSGAWLFTCGNNVNLKDMSFHGGGVAGLTFSGANNRVQGTVTASGMATGQGIGIYAALQNAGRIISCSNGGNGLDVIGGAVVIYGPTAQPMGLQGNGNHGANVVNGFLDTIGVSTIKNNNQWGVLNTGGYARLGGATIQSNGNNLGTYNGGRSSASGTITLGSAGNDIYAVNGSNCDATGATATNVSPAYNTVGNGNSYIVH